MAKAKKMPSGKWRVQVQKTIDGKTYKKSVTADTKNCAEYEALKWLNEGDDFVEDKKNIDPCEITFSEAIDEFLDVMSNLLSPCTIRGYRGIQNKGISLLADVKISNITKNLVQKQINLNAKKYSYKTCKNQLGLISRVLGEYDIHYKIVLPPKERIEYNVPSADDVPKIVNMIKDTPIELQILFALMLGLRQSEIAALKWENLKDDKIKISGAIVPNEYHRYVEKKTNKSYASARTLTVPKYILNKLNKIKKTEGYIFSTTPNYVGKVWRKLLKENGMPNYRIHDLRHANASIMLLLGVPDKYAMKRLGQSDPSMIKNVYQHTFSEEMDVINNRIDSYFDNVV